MFLSKYSNQMELFILSFFVEIVYNKVEVITLWIIANTKLHVTYRGKS